VSNHMTAPELASNITSFNRSGLPQGRHRHHTAAPFRGLSLRRPLGGSTTNPAESSSSSYGLVVRFRLLSTPPHGDAVTFSYRA
ncbi:MAG: hypothetical protein M0Q99_11270, partial [Candidatus Cloacimonetes bacterium]|nr:hypothetical protein [Candidatus Cloacimonadota bacterium]